MKGMSRYLLFAGIVVVAYLLVRLSYHQDTPRLEKRVLVSPTKATSVRQEVGEAVHDPQAPEPGPSISVAGAEDAARRDAEMYARMVGVDLETALARLGLQDEIGELNARLESREQDVFAGLWVQHTPEYKIHIYVTRDEERIFREYIQGTPLEPYVTIEQKPATLNELKQSLQEAWQIVRRVGVEATVMLSVQRNRVEIHVRDKAAFERALQEQGVILPNFTVVVEGGVIVTRTLEKIVTHTP